jgi:hypothetical protein
MENCRLDYPTGYWIILELGISIIRMVDGLLLAHVIVGTVPYALQVGGKQNEAGKELHSE